MSGHGEHNTEAFRQWLHERRGYIHPDVYLKPGMCLHFSFGLNVVAMSNIPADVQIVSCPFSLAITPEVARRALAVVFRVDRSSPTLAGWSERQLVCSYIVMHHILDGQSAPCELAHRPYINILPSTDKLRTSLHFTREELEFFRGTNLYGATFDRRKAWEEEWEMCRSRIAISNSYLAHRFTWEHYLTASTYLSSRAFPSTLLSDNPTLVSTPGSYPVLLPGVDSLNHARAQPVSWVVSNPQPSAPLSDSEPSISLALHTLTPAGAELLNNYGPKPNAELILGYGFTLPNNPDDTIVLKIGGVKYVNPTWEVGRDARGAGPVWDAVKDAVLAQNRHDVDEEERATYSAEDELWATEVLVEMAEDLLGRLPPNSSVAISDDEQSAIRPEVAQMLDHYIEGQRDILHSLMEFAKAKEQAIIERAREEGIEIVEELVT
ncbi:uncharacterized protein PHACADRAFT_126051 [Phanerochaete carnosa HHB-10118-sp]|uniref:SET domain-containing protein n=1 Tax=Phanerochaete carnosa (strain HHB-10118-sp) TaxID=650164 RepID=K5VLQ2_PHACS|nr:uncharacterized protein PHACADRAFT_126051 [Phanerochaete carnosa HHB-10118-sp]EKM52323.1 hypothetical protein PHACADRAFT_126051 [Phanerochaete carnosa HHB-10118-sp]